MQCDEHQWTWAGTCARCGVTRIDAEAAALIEEDCTKDGRS